MMRSTPQVLLLFLDGVGIGSQNPKKNPFFAFRLTSLYSLLNGHIPHLRDAHYSSSKVSLVPLNVTLGVSGLPQSGTGQTSLLTGINASRLIGKHFGPYPFSALRPIIKEQNIYRNLQSLRKTVFYANAFPRQFFEHITSKQNRMSAITMAWLMSGFELNDSTTLAEGKAVSADITNERWNKLGYPDMPVISPQTAGERLVRLAEQYDFVLFEYYVTDHAGHSQSMEEAYKVLTTFDEMLEGILSNLDRNSMLLIITSDHGNLEDLSTKSHTRNPVPLLVVGSKHKNITGKAKNLTHVAPAILNVFQ